MLDSHAAYETKPENKVSAGLFWDFLCQHNQSKSLYHSLRYTLQTRAKSSHILKFFSIETSWVRSTQFKSSSGPISYIFPLGWSIKSHLKHSMTVQSSKLYISPNKNMVRTFTAISQYQLLFYLFSTCPSLVCPDKFLSPLSGCIRQLAWKFQGENWTSVDRRKCRLGRHFSG